MEPEPSTAAFPKVDALFSGELPEVRDLRPLINRLAVLLAFSAPLNLAGVFCFTGVPGALLTLWAWLLADGEAARVREGGADPEQGARLLRMRDLAAWNLGLCVSSLLVQAWLLTTGFYEALLGRLLF